jgi:hypothetical protein
VLFNREGLWTKADSKHVVYDVITMLGLHNVRHSFVGSIEQRGISGQKDLRVVMVMMMMTMVVEVVVVLVVMMVVVVLVRDDGDVEASGGGLVVLKANWGYVPRGRGPAEADDGGRGAREEASHALPR